MFNKIFETKIKSIRNKYVYKKFKINIFFTSLRSVQNDSAKFYFFLIFLLLQQSINLLK
jgi:hypothetical protein